MLKCNKLKQLNLIMIITGLLTVLQLFAINGICISGRSEDILIIFFSLFMIATTALFIASWLNH